MERKGIHTTEFWLSLAVTIVGFVTANLPADSNTVKIAGVVSAVLAQLGYTAGRSYVKAQQ